MKTSRQRWENDLGKDLVLFLEEVKKLVPPRATYTVSSQSKALWAPIIYYYLYPRRWIQDAGYILHYDDKVFSLEIENISTVSPQYPIVWSRKDRRFLKQYPMQSLHFIYNELHQKIIKVLK